MAELEEVRLDKLLMQRGFASSRQRAVELIKNGSVIADSKVITRPGVKLPEEVSIEVTDTEMPWVSRAALKLEAALDKWKINPENKVCIDVGASTGGFTELLLDRGAKKIFAVDTGKNQLVEKLKSDERVVNLENTDIRKVNASDLPDIDLIVVDVSFISLKLIFPALLPFLENNPDIVCLIKPQFEVGKENVGKRGIVKSPQMHSQAVENVLGMVAEQGWTWCNLIKSPIKGGEGNVEFLAHLKTETRNQNI